MSTAVHPNPTGQLDNRIYEVWQRSQWLHRSAGLLALVRWLVPLFVVAVVIDWLFDVPAAGRMIVLVALLVISLLKAWQAGWRYLQSFDATQTALQLETHHGGLESLLVSAVQLRDPKAVASASQALRDRTCQQAEQAASTLRADEAVSFHGLQFPGVVALILAALLGVAAIVNGPFLAAAFSRIFTPWQTAEYPTYTQVELLEGDLVVKQGSGVQIEASVAGVVPSKAKLLLQTGEGSPRSIELEVANGSCQYTIASASRDFTYMIKAGDDRTAWHKVRVIPSPRVEKVDVELQFADYLQREPETLEALTMTVPEGTTVRWKLTLDRPVSKAAFLRDGDQPRDLEVLGDGKQVEFSAAAPDSRGYSFAWVEKEHNFEFNSSRYFLQVASDQSPRVELTSPSLNLVAMIGRPLELRVRAQDDHGLSANKVVYRVNRLAEQTTSLPTVVDSNGGEQSLDWDYRTALPDLKIGDTVAFAVEVSDAYPEPDGPHVARSDTRRITFLSREEYLEQIGRQKDRLLSVVRTIYRQQRAAHEIVRNLDAQETSYRQTCQLEAIRQEMVRKQLNETAGKFQVLLDDLKANGVAEAAEGEFLAQIRTDLISIAEQNVAKAAELLREQVGATQGASKDAGLAGQAVNAAARELAGLVLLRDIDSAQEVFARETHMLAQVQASLRLAVIESKAVGELDEQLQDQQQQLAEWTDRLLSDLLQGMRYDNRPLAVLRLIRSVKDLRSSGALKNMRDSAKLLEQQKWKKVAPIQAGIVKTLLDAEFSVRLSGEFANLMQARNLIVALVLEQRQLVAELEATSTEEATRNQSAIRRRMLLMLLPTIPPPRAQLFDESVPQPPPLESLLAKADGAMAGGIAKLAAGDKQAAIGQLQEAEQLLEELAGVVDRWSVETGLQTQGLGTIVAATSERLGLIEEYEARVIGLLERTDEAIAENGDLSLLVEPQSMLADELASFADQLSRQNQAEPDRDLPPLLGRLTQVNASLGAATTALKEKSGDQAIAYQEEAADGLAETFAIVEAQSERLGLLQDLLMFQRSVGFANGYVADIVAEQRDLQAATEAIEPAESGPLMPQFANLRRCFEDVAPLLDLVAARMDAGTPLAFAKTDLEDAMISLEGGDKLDSLDAQDVAAESLEEVRRLVSEVQVQTGYIAEIVELLHSLAAEAITLQFEQQELLRRAESAGGEDLKKVIASQRELLAKAQVYGQQLERATGMAEFTDAAAEMSEAVAQLEAGEVDAAREQMELSSVVLEENGELLVIVITMLHGLPSIEINVQSEPALVRLVDVLAVASAHKQVFRQTQSAGAQLPKELAEQQGELAAKLQPLTESGEANPLLAAAQEQLTAAVAAFEESKVDAVAESQRTADEKLRHFVIEQAVILETAAPEPAPSDGLPTDDGPGSDGESEFSAGFISDFVSGETPQDKRAEWKVLGERNRAALNQNFARELPLEYRGMLKDYYERVAK